MKNLTILLILALIGCKKPNNNTPKVTVSHKDTTLWEVTISAELTQYSMLFKDSLGVTKDTVYKGGTHLPFIYFSHSGYPLYIKISPDGYINTFNISVENIYGSGVIQHIVLYTAPQNPVIFSGIIW